MRLLIHLMLISTLAPAPSFAQVFPFLNLQSATQQNCEHDASQQVLTFPRWEGYQTSNGEWDGPIDSTVCLDISDTTSFGKRMLEINYDQIDKSKPVFIRAKLDSASKVLLDKNSVYRIEFDFDFQFDNWNVDTSKNCANNLCSGALIGVEIPDSSGSGNVMRWTPAPFNRGPVNAYPSYSRPSYCFVTEKFTNENYLREFIFKITFDQPPAQDSLLLGARMNRINAHVRQVTEVNADTVIGSSYQTNIGGINGAFLTTNFLLMYIDSTYPSAQNISYIPVSPKPNTNTKETIDVMVKQDQVLLSQPFVQLRGVHPTGQPTKRHQVNLINNGGKICMIAVVEKRFEHGNKYVHNAGKVNFESPRSCFLFGKEGALKVPDNVTFHYGSRDRGMLLLKTGGTIEIGENAELVVQGHMNLKEYKEDDGPQDIYMTLDEGSRLTFAEGSRLTNMWSKDGSIKLNVYMKGGVLDDSGLSPEDRQLINRIYPSEDYENEERLRILQNPAQTDHIRYSVTLPKEQNFTYRLVDINGSVLKEGEQTGIKGRNDFSLSSRTLSPGVYLLNIDFRGDLMDTKKVVVN